MPEICRADLKSEVLLLKCLGVDDLAAFELITPPGVAALELALEELYALGALDAEARLVEPLGLRMAHGPLPPALMRLLLLAAEPPHACANEAATICAMLTLKSPWLRGQNADRLAACQQSFAVYEGDVVTLLNIARQYEAHREEDPEWAKRHALNAPLLERAAQVRRQLLQYLERHSLPLESCEGDVLRLQRLLCAALFLNAARRAPDGDYRLLRPVDPRAPHARFQLHPSSVLSAVGGHSPSDWIIFVEAMCHGSQPQLLHSTRIRPEWLPELASHYFQGIAAGEAEADSTADGP